MAEAEVANAPIPERVGRYEIILPIASGGMATVYLARALAASGFSRSVALKLTHAHLRETPEFTNDLVEEAKLASQVRHPNVVPVLEVDDDPLGMYLIMEYVEGETLGGLRRRAAQAKRPLPPAVGMRILLDAMAGLHSAHELRDEKGELVALVHRDFSPQNILVGLDGTSRLTDFGIAKAATRLGHTRQGLVKGKISYMAPEQARSLPLDRRCDVWAAGVIAWELFAQRRLHPGGDGDVGTLLKVVSEEPPHLRTLIPELPPDIERIVARALTIDRDQRYPTALAMSRELMAACKAHGLLAEHDQVASFVSQIVGPKLAERRGRAAEVLRLRAKMGAPGTSQETNAKIAQDIQNAIRPLAEMLEPEQDSDIEAAIAPLLPDTRVAPLQSDPDVEPFDSISIPGPMEGTTGAAASVTYPHSEAKNGAGGRRDVAPQSPWLYVGIGAALLVGVFIGAMAPFKNRADAPVAASSAQPNVSLPPAVSVATSSPPESLAAPATSATSAEVASASPQSSTKAVVPGTLIVHANAPVAELDVDGRAVALAIPTKEPFLELSSEERSRTIKVTARSTDGRESTLAVLPGVEEITIEFFAKKERDKVKVPRRTH